MKNKPLFYVRSITNLSDARYCASMGVDFMGISVDPLSPHYLPPERFQEIASWVAGPRWVVQTNQSCTTDLPESIIQHYSPYAIHHSIHEIEQPIVHQVPWIVDFEFNHRSFYKTVLESLISPIEFLVLTNLPMEKEVIKSLKSDPIPFPYLLAIDKNYPLSTVMLFEHTNTVGFMLEGTNEIEPGLKDYDHLAKIMESWSA